MLLQVKIVYWHIGCNYCKFWHVSTRDIVRDGNISQYSVLCLCLFRKNKFYPYHIFVFREMVLLSQNDFNMRIQFCVGLNYKKILTFYLWSDKATFKNDRTINNLLLERSQSIIYWMRTVDYKHRWNIKWAGIIGVRLFGPSFFEDYLFS